MTKRRIATADCETDPFKAYRIPKPYIWGFYDGSQYRTFRTTKEFVEFIAGENIILFAHNGGKFDWHYLLEFVEPYDDIMLINGRIAKMRIGQCELRDSYCLLPVPLSAYKKDEIDYSIMEPGERDKPKNRAIIESYLKADCVYLYELVSRAIDEYGLNLTQAGTAMKQWAKLSPLPVPESTEDFYNDFAPFYYGGRVQCFERGIIETDFEVVDINSAYPFAMLHKHPYSTNYSDVAGYRRNADFYTVRCISRGAFPYRGESAGLDFPDDDTVREYTITGWEYAAALETGTIENVKVLRSITFMSHVDFSDYIIHFYNKRQECKARNDDAGSLLCKLLMNSLYGKFAANPASYKNHMVIPLEVAPGLDALGWTFAGEFGPWGLAESPLDPERRRYYNVATGASITGFVRAMLWRAICSSDGVLYCDTDSLAVREAGPAVELGDKLGQWKHEGYFDRAGIGGKKMYIFRGEAGQANKTASKGVRLTDRQLWALARGKTVNYVSNAPTFSATRSMVNLLNGADSARENKKNTKMFFSARSVKST